VKPETVMTPEGREVTLIHFVKEGRIVCMPNMLPKDMAATKERMTPHMRTGEPSGVTCPMCKRTKEWAESK
jgi:hypothetical protein